MIPPRTAQDPRHSGRHRETWGNRVERQAWRHGGQEEERQMDGQSNEMTVEPGLWLHEIQRREPTGKVLTCADSRGAVGAPWLGKLRWVQRSRRFRA